MYGHCKEKIDIGQPRSQSYSAISDVTSPVKLVGKIRYRARFQASSGHSDSANRPGYEAEFWPFLGHEGLRDQLRFLGNCPPTPPVTQHFAPSDVRGGVGGQFPINLN